MVRVDGLHGAPGRGAQIPAVEALGQLPQKALQHTSTGVVEVGCGSDGLVVETGSHLG